MARDRGGYAEALEHVKHALEGDKRDPDVWTAWGNIHLAKKEVQNAQKKFEQVLEEAKVCLGLLLTGKCLTADKLEQVKDDPYALLALGNIWLAEAQSARSIANPDAQKRAIKYAKLNFRSVLKKEPRNVFAAHGIGCVLAVEGRLSEAKDVFVSVREAESDIPEPWLNLAHVYLDQKNYVNAIKLSVRHSNRGICHALTLKYGRLGTKTHLSDSTLTTMLKSCRQVFLWQNKNTFTSLHADFHCCLGISFWQKHTFAQGSSRKHV